MFVSVSELIQQAWRGCNEYIALQYFSTRQISSKMCCAAVFSISSYLFVYHDNVLYKSFGGWSMVNEDIYICQQLCWNNLFFTQSWGNYSKALTKSSSWRHWMYYTSWCWLEDCLEGFHSCLNLNYISDAYLYGCNQETGCLRTQGV